MQLDEILQLIRPYSPWIDPLKYAEWAASVPSFRRPVFETLIEDLEHVPQILQVTGPRRVGKSTLLSQIVRHLLRDKQVAPQRILYYDFGDPLLFRPGFKIEDFIDSLMQQMSALGKTGPAYLFLDEIQKLERWELYLKKYYDLKYPVKMMISGSASSPIFKKSHESLLGRVKDYHVLPFSFAEYLMFQVQSESGYSQELAAHRLAGKKLMGILSKSPKFQEISQVDLPGMSDGLWSRAEGEFESFLLAGGFPEVWGFSEEKRIEYLYDNQVKKVIDEDLVLAAEFRKPEILKRFYISLLERPGQEVTRKSLSQDTGVNVQQIDKYLPLLQLTDLIRSIHKFRKSSLKILSPRT